MLNSPVGYCIFWYCCQSEPHLFRELVVDGTAGGGRRWSRKPHGVKTHSPRRKNKHGKLGTPHQKPRFSWENNGNILEYIIMTHCRLKHGTEQFHFSSINLSKIDMKSQNHLQHRTLSTPPATSFVLDCSRRGGEQPIHIERFRRKKSNSNCITSKQGKQARAASVTNVQRGQSKTACKHP